MGILLQAVKVEESAGPELQVTFASARFTGRPHRRPPDVQCAFAPGSFKNGQIGALEETPGLSAGAWQMRPRRAAMSRPSRAGRATRRRATRAMSRRNPTGARSSAACAWRAACSPPPFVREESLSGLHARTDECGATYHTS